MRDSSQEFSVLTRGRFLAAVGCLFALQAGLIALFGARGTNPAKAPIASTQFREVGTLNQEQLRRLFFASDPAVFASPSAHGFSGRAWMDQPPARFQSTSQVEAPRWLALDAARLGTGSDVDDSDASAPWTPARLEIQKLEPLPVFLSPVIVPTQSVFRIEGELVKRLISPAPDLHAWPSLNRKLLGNTVVQIAVNPSGDVMAARLVNGSGSPEADGDAMAKASALRFRPAADARTAWARAVFRWQTTFPAAAGTPP
jgi:TonB family protein